MAAALSAACCDAPSDDTRAALAERYVSNYGLSLTDIAHRLGFAAPSAFSRWFRRRSGMSPTEWRRSAEATHTGESVMAVTRFASHRQA